MGKVNLLGLPLGKLEDFFDSIGEKKFRATQLIKWIHQEGQREFSKMTNLSKSLRETLARKCEIKLPEIVSCDESSDGTKKWLIKVDGGSCIEMVFIPERERGTLCISSQVGCSLDCSFCATGKQGFHRDLTSAEIIGQLWLANFHNKEINQITNVVFMGMGEPLLNYDAVLESAKIMKDPHSYGLSRKRITISTSGIVPNILKLSQDIDVSLAISLHASDDILRDEIVPINKKYPIKALLGACKEYLSSFKNKKTITMEYILIDGINDSIEHAKQLAILLSDISCKINLIPFNNFKGATYKRPSNNKMSIFKKYLMDKGFIATLRITRGDSVAAACGQLVGDLSNTVKGKNLIKHRSINER